MQMFYLDDKVTGCKESLCQYLLDFNKLYGGMFFRHLPGLT